MQYRVPKTCRAHVPELELHHVYLRLFRKRIIRGIKELVNFDSFVVGDMTESNPILC